MFFLRRGAALTRINHLEPYRPDNRVMEGRDALGDPLRNKGTASTHAERERLGS
jgi:hypothetical protein